MFRSIKFSFIISLLAILVFPVTANALSGADWRAGNIIDDSIFYNNGDMSVSSIQNFMNSKLSSCDTWGTKPSEKGGGTRAQYGTSKGYPPPYTCLKDYSQNGKSSAQIIKEAADANQISPRVLLVLLQKEQSLVTDEWPWSIQYRSATGYGCPDTAPCDAQYYGFTNQVNKAAWQFRRYATNPGSYRYRPFQNNYIQYNPNTACGGTNVYIENYATAGLYNYTPYQPNASALSNLYGTGDGCGAYGNRNFWRLFRDWFGVTHITAIPGCQEATNTSLSCVWKAQLSNGSEKLTTDYGSINHFVNSQGFGYGGVKFYARNPNAPKSGNIPVYGMTKPNGETFLTTSLGEYSALSGAFTPNWIAFYADPPNSNSGYPVYRLYNNSNGQHVWTTNPYGYPSSYTQESTPFTALSPVQQEKAPPTGQNLVYRFRDMPNNTHFWTTDVNERDSMIRSGYAYDGVAWTSLKTQPGKPIYRLYSPGLKQHLFTTDWSEVHNISTNHGWIYEGISMYASTSGKPVFRLYRPQTGEHLYTNDANERNFLISRGIFNDEGIGWYQPQ